MSTTTTNPANKDANVAGLHDDQYDQEHYDLDHDHDHIREGGEFDSEAPLTLRALVTTKEAGVIIGKAGKNVADLRDQTGVKAGVSKVVQGVHDRVLTVTGTIEGVAKTSSVRLLISHNLMGTIIGRQGLKIKYIQDASSARMVASKEMLPQSTERVVEVQGSIDAIRIAIYEIGKCLVDDWERGVGTVLYNPSAPITGNSSGAASGSRPKYTSRTGNGSDFTRTRTETFGGGGGSGGYPNNNVNNANLRTQEISIPADMVGCIIGKAGSKISEIRRLSGSRISIAKTPHDETGERLFTIVGTIESNEKALYLLYGQLELEKERRLNMAGDHVEEDEE
ncbi:RNA binding protein, heterogenous nuclear RNP-K like protein [Mortierella sp. AD010]|nr:RNA binding protein, heterogenous nuclear RNP-K like protein [Mortierella sp. AD010]